MALIERILNFIFGEELENLEQPYLNDADLIAIRYNVERIR